MRLRRWTLLVAAVIAIAIGIFLEVTRSRRDRRPTVLRIATATTGGTYADLGEQLAQILRQLPDSSIHAVAESSSGSFENVDRLLSGDAHLAFVADAAVREMPADRREGIRTLAALHSDVLQVVVREDTGIRRLEDLRGRRIYAGREGSGTRLLARQVLDSAGVDVPDGTPDVSYSEAAAQLVAGSLDAAIFAAGTPTRAVRDALASGACRLLNLEDSVESVRKDHPALEEIPIPARLYEKQESRAVTIGTRVYLMSNRNLDPSIVETVLDALFDHLGALVVAHSGAEQIRLESAFPTDPPVPLHDGAIRFRAVEDEKLLIATGAVGGKYHRVGRWIQRLLEQEGIPARAIHTDGSLENARLLADHGERALAILQYDTALATSGWNPRFVYKQPPSVEDGDLPRVEGMRRIATLHDERLFVIARRDRLPQRGGGTIEDLRDLRVCPGPARSGTRILADAVLAHHEVEPGERRFLPVADMIRQLRAHEIDAGFLVSGQPSTVLKTVLNNPELRLLAVDRQRLVELPEPIFTTGTIPPGVYRCQREGESPIITIDTKAVLVCRADLPDVERITSTVFMGSGLLGIEGSRERMATDLPGLRLHEDAVEAYRELDLLPSPPRLDPLEVVGLVLGILAILATATRAGLLLMRERSSGRFRGRILDVSTEATEPASVRKLMAIRDAIRERVRLSWWRAGHLGKQRFRELDELITFRIEEARAALVTSLLDANRRLADEPPGGDAPRTLRRRAWRHLEDGELREAQLEIVLRALDESMDGARGPGAPERKNGRRSPGGRSVP